jgi:hypothetical protein
MVSDDLLTGRVPGIFAPASLIEAAPERAPRQDSESQRRPRPRRRAENDADTEDNATSDNDGIPAHQLDDLA